MRDVMVDLETMGTAHDAAIASIGACTFDITTGEIARTTFYTAVHLHSCTEVGMTMDAGTVEFWLEQPELSRLVLLQGRSTLPDALNSLAAFMPRKPRLWSHATFDSVILDSAYRLCGIKRPWHDRGVRDIRTLVSLWGDLCPKAENPIREKPHHALKDALLQAEYCSRMYRDIAAQPPRPEPQP